MHVSGGNLNVIGGDLVQVHNHFHGFKPEKVSGLPAILDLVPNLRDIQAATLGKATGGTGDWIYLWNEFCVWRAADGHIRILWGSGIRESTGSDRQLFSKTRLSYSWCWKNHICVGSILNYTLSQLIPSQLRSLVINAIEALAQTSATPICVGFLYIRYSEDVKANLRDLLEILVRQSVERHPRFLDICKELYARHAREKTEPSARELFGLLKRFTNQLEMTTFYFVDALDEAPVNIQIDLLENLTSLNAKLFITSRPLKALQARFPSAFHFPIIAQERDLDTHIENEISRSSELKAVLANATPGLEGRITLIVKRQCGGM